MNGGELAVQVVETAVVHPGDILVISVPDAVNPKEVDELADAVKAKIGDAVRVLVIGGALQIHVLRPGEVTEGPDLRVFIPFAVDEMPRSYLPSDAIRSEAHEQAKAMLDRDHPGFRLDGAAKALRIAGDGLEQGLPAAHGYLFTYRTLARGRS